jgi:hypothetical protein
MIFLLELLLNVYLTMILDSESLLNTPLIIILAQNVAKS